MAGINTSIGARDLVTKTINKMISAYQRLDKSLASVDRAMNTVDQTSQSLDPGKPFDQARPDIDRATKGVEEFNWKQQKAEDGAKMVKSAWGSVGGLVKSAVAAFSAKKIIELADTMTTTRARLDLMNDGLQTTDELQDKIMKSANRSRAAYQTTANAVSKMGLMAGDTFKSNDELIAFVEQINKQFTIAGTSAGGIDAAMLQLTQAMGSGVLRGEELNSVFEQAPTIIQTIADYLGVPIGKIREMAQEGKISADIVKNAMLSSAEATNEKFNSMPMTFSQVWNQVQNVALQAFEPLIQAIGAGAQWISDNWSTVEPILWGVAAAVSYLVGGMLVWKVVTWAQTIAQHGLNSALVASGIGAVAIAIGIIIAMIVKWIQSVGGIKVAWMIVCNYLLFAWDWVKIAFFTGVYWVIDLWNKMQLAWVTAVTAIQNWCGDLKAGVLMILQNMVNGAIGIINSFINLLNKIPGVNISVIDQVTFGTTAQLENEAAKQARNRNLDEYRDKIESQIQERENKLSQMKTDAANAKAAREAEIAAERSKKLAEAGKDAFTDQFGTNVNNVANVDEVGKVKDDINISDEDLKFLRDVAEMRFVQNFVTLTPTVAVDAKINERVDMDEVVNRIESKLEDEFVIAAEGVYA